LAQRVSGEKLIRELCLPLRCFSRREPVMLRAGIFLFFFLLGCAGRAQNNDELRKSIYFDGGSHYIDELQGEVLMRWLDSIPNLLEKYDIQLISHTDPVGGRQYNQWLSRMRSRAVLELLKQQNIPEEKISVKDWGLENPVFSNDSYRGRMMNRRVDVILRPLVF
jgi:outer membrane protein OmpA-like peptidoglycan-associated protein